MIIEWLLWSNYSQFPNQQPEQILRGAANGRSIFIIVSGQNEARLTSFKGFVVDTPMKVLRYFHDYFLEDVMVENRKDFVDPTTIANGKEYPKLSKAIKSTIPYSGSEGFEFDKDWIEIRNMLRRLRRVEHKGVIFNFKNSPSKYDINTTF